MPRKTALITGATKGLGRGAAQAIAEAGGDIIAIGRNQVELDTLGKIVNYEIAMGKSVEGTLVLFPAQLKHSVNQFYNCDEPRISVAGNISLYSYPPKNK